MSDGRPDVALCEVLRQTLHQAGTLTPFCRYLVRDWLCSEIYFSRVGGEHHCPFARKQTDTMFCVQMEKHERLVVFEPFVLTFV